MHGNIIVVQAITWDLLMYVGVLWFLLENQNVVSHPYFWFLYSSWKDWEFSFNGLLLTFLILFSFFSKKLNNQIFEALKASNCIYCCVKRGFLLERNNNGSCWNNYNNTFFIPIFGGRLHESFSSSLLERCYPPNVIFVDKEPLGVQGCIRAHLKYSSMQCQIPIWLERNTKLRTERFTI